MASCRRRSLSVLAASIAMSFVLVHAREVQAQAPPPPPPTGSNGSHWGVAVSFTPVMSSPSAFEDLIGATIDFQGPEFTIGIARGRMDGGDWAVSFLRKKLDDDSVYDESELECQDNGQCFTDGDRMLTRGVTFTALEARKSVVFKTFSRRVQVGIDFAGGFGQYSGDVEIHSFSPDFNFVPGPGGGSTVITQGEEVTTEPANGNLLFGTEYTPIGRLHVAVGFNVMPGVKVRASGGIGFPMNHVFTLTGVYLFGAR